MNYMTKLFIFIYLKTINHNSTFIIINQFIKMIYYKLMQIIFNKSILATSYILLYLITVIIYIDFTRKSNKNFMIICKKNL